LVDLRWPTAGPHQGQGVGGCGPLTPEAPQFHRGGGARAPAKPASPSRWRATRLRRPHERHQERAKPRQRWHQRREHEAQGAADCEVRHARHEAGVRPAGGEARGGAERVNLRERLQAPEACT
jgi:hypothetical protein